MTPIALIVGSGFASLGFEVLTRSPTKTPYGEPSSAVLTLGIAGARVPCIARHGEEHHLAPHEINYRANLWALAQRGVRACVGINTVGAIDPKFLPGELAVPDQLIDYTHGRLSSYGGAGAPVRHVELERTGVVKQLTAALVVKRLALANRPSVAVSGLAVDDVYVFGSGMDYRGYWRGVAGIYAVAERA